MNKDINRLVEETISCMDNLPKTDAPAGLSFKIVNRLNKQKNTSEVYLIKHPQWMIAALLIGIVCNICFALSYQQNSTNSTNSEVSDFVSHYKLGSTSIY